MKRLPLCFLPLALAAVAPGQFSYPTPEEHRQAVPGTYKEDPFITKYRQKFFAVFKGDFATFNAAYDEIAAMVKKDPKDARALVWLGNGQTIRAGQKWLMGDKTTARTLLETSRKTIDAAVAIKPDDYGVYMMRAATLFVQGQYFPETMIPRSNWEKLRDDCLHLIKDMGPKRMAGASPHVRGETYGELGVAYAHLGEKGKARAAFEQVIKFDPGGNYEKRARAELAKL